MNAAITRTTPIDELPQLVRVDEASAWLGCSRGLVFELCRRGDLQSIRLGRLLRIPREALAARVNGKNGHAR
jgi:excisionase family DNA binding protein